ncbi:MAG: tRNA dimethylallyltransferase [Arenicella sp.]
MDSERKDHVGTAGRKSLGNLELKVSKVLTILGPTASGKTELACQLALNLDAEIISADSRQLYKFMDIGTGKDIEEYTIERTPIPYHLIDIREPSYKYNIAEYQLDFHKALADIQNRNKIAVLCGGSGLYIETALRGSSYLGIETDAKLISELKTYSDAQLENEYQKVPENLKEELNALTNQRKIRAIGIHQFIQTNPTWKKRNLPKVDSLIIGVDIDRDLRREKITKRLSYRLNHGLIEEAESLLDKHLTSEEMSFFGLEYKWLSEYLQGNITKKELFEGLNTAIHQFSKRQMTWFRRMEKNGYKIHWVNANDSIESKKDQVLELYSQK